MEATEHILSDPAPSVYLTAFGESGIEFTVYCWSSAEDFWTTQFALAENLRREFAQAGVEIREAEPGRALCAMPLRPCHMNANGAPMGGAIFTLADFAYAVASNGFTDRIIVSQQVAITFLAPARGTELLAEAKCLKSGRTTCLYAVDVRDELGTYVAHATVNGFTVK